MILNLFDDLQKLWNELVANIDPKRSCITVCSGTGCQAYGCNEIAAKFHQILEEQKLTDKVDIKRTGCHGFCERGPIVVIYPEELCYLQVKPEDILEIISKTIKKDFELKVNSILALNKTEDINNSEKGGNIA